MSVCCLTWCICGVYHTRMNMNDTHDMPSTNTSAIARAFLDSLPEELTPHIRPSSDPLWGQAPTFDGVAVDYLTVELQAVIASVIASLIDAGSERDAINEDEDLGSAIETTLKGW